MGIFLQYKNSYIQLGMIGKYKIDNSYHPMYSKFFKCNNFKENKI